MKKIKFIDIKRKGIDIDEVIRKVGDKWEKDILRGSARSVERGWGKPTSETDNLK